MTGRRWLLLIPLLVPLVWAARPALALTLDEAKAQGLVGERPDGFVGIVVTNPPPELRALVGEVNDKRRAAYEEIARKNGVPVDAVAALAGRKLIEKTPPGQWIMDAQGNWMRK